MKIDGKDFPKLQASLFAALLMMAIGAATVYGCLSATRAAQLAQASAQAQRNEIARKLKRLVSEEHEIKQDSALFKKLQTQGIVGEERRLEWVEQLKAIRDQRKLLDLQYEIAPRRPLDAVQETGLAYYASAMKLQLKLLHEEDLLRLIDDLHRQASALTQVKSCNVWLLPKESAERGPQAQLQAECQIDWITLHDNTEK